MALSKELLDILVCPKCKGDLEYREQECQMICQNCALIFPIKDDIPIMLPEEAQRLKQ
jgi:uncharacterized protein YbaR (Trm112 family)